jgi:hypothetical protein
MGEDVLRQAEQIATRAVLAHECAERWIAERIATDLVAGRTWRCRGCDAYLRSNFWLRPASGLCSWCSPDA